ncbi:hypothetical protein [Flavobacterium xanthum]|nr:hypothetical protein [Flavobacterium xanthum]
MKKYFIILIIMLISSVLFAQNESAYLSIGKPWFPDKYNNHNNFSIGFNYQNAFVQSFAFTFIADYAQSDDFPKFAKNEVQLNAFLLDQNSTDIVSNSLWSKIKTIRFGGEMNYMFVNNKRFSFSFNAGAGHFFSQSSSHDLQSFTYNLETREILSYQNKISSEKLNSFYYSLGIQFQYCIYKDYFIGLQPFYFMPIGEKQINSIPVYPSYYNLTLNIGKKS